MAETGSQWAMAGYLKNFREESGGALKNCLESLLLNKEWWLR
jgi:hypothetical protein